MQAPVAGRAYDALYDPLFTVSGARDFYRQQTVAGGFQVERAPDFPNAFSVLPHHPATTYRLKNSDKVPNFVDRQFHPTAHNPADLHMRSDASNVNGTTRPLYFRRPMLAASEAVIVKQAQLPPLPAQPVPVAEPRSKTIGTQSDYRESEAQTTPWEPEVRLPSQPSLRQQALSAKYNCEGPELLHLRDLKFGDGLPPGLQEVRRIEKMREKRAFEATLPPLSDVERLPLRQAMLEEWEHKEWQEREEEILSIQNERLKLLGQALNVREEEYDMETLRRIEERKTLMLQEKGGKFAELQASRIKTMRQLIEARKYVEKPRKLQKPDIVERYANYGSSTYAPVQREGRFPETKPQGKAIETEGFQPATLQGICDLEAFIPKRMLNPIVSVPKPPAKLDFAQRQDAAIQKDLKAINDLLDAAKTVKGRGFGECWPAPLKDDVELRAVRNKGTKRIQERPETPVLPAPAAPSGTRDAAIALLQRLLRGRAAQNIMYEGKSRRQELIQELQLEECSASSVRPELLHGGEQRMDALVGEIMAQLCVALTETNEARRAQMLQDILAPPTSKPVTPIIRRPASSQKPSDSAGAAASENGALGPSPDEAEAAAIKIQAAMKGRLARKQVAAKKEALAFAQQSANLDENSAALGGSDRDQALADGDASVGQEVLDTDPNQKSDAQTDPATGPRAAPDFEALGVSVQEAEEAAIKIQAAMKGRMARKEVAAMRNAAAGTGGISVSVDDATPEAVADASGADALATAGASESEVAAGTVPTSATETSAVPGADGDAGGADADSMVGASQAEVDAAPTDENLTVPVAQADAGSADAPVTAGASETEVDAAIKIQAAMKGRLARKEVAAMKAAAAGTGPTPATETSAVPGADGDEGGDADAMVGASKAEVDATATDENDAVPAAQADAGSADAASTAGASETEVEAAIKIQAAMKGRLARKEVAAMKAAAAGTDAAPTTGNEAPEAGADANAETAEAGPEASEPPPSEIGTIPEADPGSGDTAATAGASETEVEAAIKIQAAMKGRMARKEVAAMRAAAAETVAAPAKENDAGEAGADAGADTHSEDAAAAAIPSSNDATPES